MNRESAWSIKERTVLSGDVYYANRELAMSFRMNPDTRKYSVDPKPQTLTKQQSQSSNHDNKFTLSRHISRKQGHVRRKYHRQVES